MPGHGQDSFLCCTADPRFGKACGTGLGRARGHRSNGVSWRPSGGSDSVPVGLECAFAASSREPLPRDPEVGTPARQPLSLSARPDVPAGRSQCWRGRELSVPASRTSRWRGPVPASAGSAGAAGGPPPGNRLSPRITQQSSQGADLMDPGRLGHPAAPPAPSAAGQLPGRGSTLQPGRSPSCPSCIPLFPAVHHTCLLNSHVTDGTLHQAPGSPCLTPAPCKQ